MMLNLDTLAPLSDAEIRAMAEIAEKAVAAMSDQTAARYEKVAGRNIRRLPKDSRTPDGLVADLISRSKGLSASSWRQYKAANIFFLRRTLANAVKAHDAKLGTAVAFPKAVQKIAAAIKRLCQAERPRNKDTQGGKTKIKAMPDCDLDRITIYLQTSTSQHASLLSYALVALRLTGMRPSESIGAKIAISGQGLSLEVQNGKYRPDGSGQRAHGPTRTLTWDHADAKDLHALRQWLAHIGGMDRDTFDRLAERLQRFLRDICRRLWPQRRQGYGLYSCRHQAIADWKAAYAGDPDALAIVAALAGHATDETATRHYARKEKARKSRGSSIPRPVPAEVARIRPAMAGRMKEPVKELEGVGPEPEATGPAPY